MPPDELAAWLRLTLTPGVGNATARRLLAAFGLPQQVFAQSASALRQVVTAAQASALLQEPPGLPAQIETTWQWLMQPGEEAGGPQDAAVTRSIVTLGDENYPPSLLATEDPPLLLYLMGRCDWLQATGWPAALAIVGSRNPTPQGQINARQFAQALAGQMAVVSGLALGIDGAAHEGALQGAQPERLATIAVIGTGADRVYPARHRDLAHRIARQGLLVSEYPLGTPPAAANFPKRNRIISGLSLGALVVEAALQSGSLITARLAAEQGKEVFAIPGSIHGTQSRGCHALIRQGAKLVETAQDILEELRLPASRPQQRAEGQRHQILEELRLPASRPAPAAPATPAPSTAPTVSAPPPAGGPHASLLTALGADPASLDALQARTGWPTPQLQAALLELELAGQVGRLPGGLFQRLGAA